MASDRLINVLIVILVIDMLFFLFQVSMIQVNNEYSISDENPGFYDYTQSFISQFDKGNYTLINKSLDVLPEESQAVSQSGDGSVFTDAIKSVSNWVKGTSSSIVTGATYLFNILGGPTVYLSAIGAPREVVFSIGSIWYAISLILLLGFIWGRL